MTEETLEPNDETHTSGYSDASRPLIPKLSGHLFRA